MHPLWHKYYFSYTERSDFEKVILDENDKQHIRNVVDWCFYDRGLGCIALTDHDMIQASLYSVEYVKQAGYPIEVITGAECSVSDPNRSMGDDEVHLLCLGIDKLPRYDRWTPVDKMIEAVHELGGYVIMSHPVQYPKSFFRFCELLDGYEYQNGNHEPFDEGLKYVGAKGLPIRSFCNSDYHYIGGVAGSGYPDLHCNHYGDIVSIIAGRSGR